MAADEPWIHVIKVLQFADTESWVLLLLLCDVIDVMRGAMKVFSHYAKMFSAMWEIIHAFDQDLSCVRVNVWQLSNPLTNYK